MGEREVGAPCHFPEFSIRGQILTDCVTCFHDRL